MRIVSAGCVASCPVSERALLFGAAAEAYERHRLGYPSAVADLTLAYARRSVARVRRTVLADESFVTEARSPAGTWWPGSELEADPRFGDVEEHDLPRVVRRARAEHLALLGTLSTYLQLPEDVRTPLLARIGEQLPDQVEADATVRPHLGRRRGGVDALKVGGVGDGVLDQGVDLGAREHVRDEHRVAVAQHPHLHAHLAGLEGHQAV